MISNNLPAPELARLPGVDLAPRPILIGVEDNCEQLREMVDGVWSIVNKHLSSKLKEWKSGHLPSISSSDCRFLPRSDFLECQTLKQRVEPLPPLISTIESQYSDMARSVAALAKESDKLRCREITVHIKKSIPAMGFSAGKAEAHIEELGPQIQEMQRRIVRSGKAHHALYNWILETMNTDDVRSFVSGTKAGITSMVVAGVAGGLLGLRKLILDSQRRASFPDRIRARMAKAGGGDRGQGTRPSSNQGPRGTASGCQPQDKAAGPTELQERWQPMSGIKPLNHLVKDVFRYKSKIANKVLRLLKKLEKGVSASGQSVVDADNLWNEFQKLTNQPGERGPLEGITQGTGKQRDNLRAVFDNESRAKLFFDFWIAYKSASDADKDSFHSPPRSVRRSASR